jgi:thioredoxin 1
MKSITATEFESEVLKSTIPVVVDFSTESCPPCRALKPILEEIELMQAGRLKVVKVDAAEETELAVQHRVSAVPALFLYREGQCVGQRVGLASKKDLLNWIASA